MFIIGAKELQYNLWKTPIKWLRTVKSAGKSGKSTTRDPQSLKGSDQFAGYSFSFLVSGLLGSLVRAGQYLKGRLR
jgi:hypothetical protein